MSLIRTFDFCLWSGLFFNFYCVTANLHDERGNFENYRGFGNDQIVQSDMIKVSAPSSSRIYHPNSYFSFNPYLPKHYDPRSRFVDNSFMKFERNQKIANGYWRDPWKSFSNSFDSKFFPFYPPSNNHFYFPYSNYGYDSKYIRPAHSNSWYNTPMLFSNTGQGHDWYPRFQYYPNYSVYPSVQRPSNYAYSPNPLSLPRVTRAVAEISGPGRVSGSISFEQLENNFVNIRGKIYGLIPGAHGIHILENSNHDCTVRGEHYNPQKTDHGGKHDWVRHVGDLGNIYADRDGTAFFDVTDQILNLTGPESVVNRTIEITENPDDLGRSESTESKLTGNSGLPIACGYIKLVKE